MTDFLGQTNSNHTNLETSSWLFHWCSFKIIIVVFKSHIYDQNIYDSESNTLYTLVKISAHSSQNLCPMIFPWIKISALNILQNTVVYLNEGTSYHVLFCGLRYHQYIIIGAVTVSFVFVVDPWVDVKGTINSLVED